MARVGSDLINLLVTHQLDIVMLGTSLIRVGCYIEFGLPGEEEERHLQSNLVGIMLSSFNLQGKEDVYSTCVVGDSFDHNGLTHNDDKIVYGCENSTEQMMVGSVACGECNTLVPLYVPHWLVVWLAPLGSNVAHPVGLGCYREGSMSHPSSAKKINQGAKDNIALSKIMAMEQCDKDVVGDIPRRGEQSVPYVDLCGALQTVVFIINVYSSCDSKDKRRLYGELPPARQNLQVDIRKFTWIRLNETVMCRLDRILVSHAWQDLYGSTVQ
ncbi:hypothetical protein RIF29_29785 [Crotalaria pallida]|uniref:Uncharacterized protein n=1 Tax=Crotalaria pallida TaxID=3830 RepID=A0AAN9HU75_CROPI